MGVEGFLFFIYDLLATAVYFLDLGDHSVHECRGKFNQLEKIGDLLFQVPDLHVFVGTFDLIAGSVAVVIRFIFLWVMFGSVSLPTDRAECKTSQYEVKFLPTAGISVVFGHHQLSAFPCFFGDERFMLSRIYQSSPAHLAVVERIFEYLDHLAVREPLAGVGSKSLFIQRVADFINRIVAGHVHFERFLNERCSLLVHDDDPLFLVARIAGVKISICHAGRPPTVPEFLLEALQSFSRRDLRLELVHSGNHQVHEISLRRIGYARLGDGKQFDIMLFENRFDLHVIERVSRQSVGVLYKYCANGFIVLDPKKHILESWTVHICGRSPRVFKYAFVRQFIFVAFLDRSLAKLELGCEGVVAILGLFFGRDSAVD